MIEDNGPEGDGTGVSSREEVVEVEVKVEVEVEGRGEAGSMAEATLYHRADPRTRHGQREATLDNGNINVRR